MNAPYALTYGEVAERLGRRWIGIELSAEYVALARRRTAQTGLLFKSSGPRSGPLSSPRSGRRGICLDGSPEGRSLWGKPGLGGFEPARGEAPIEAAVLGTVKEL